MDSLHKAVVILEGVVEAPDKILQIRLNRWRVYRIEGSCHVDV
jgi:hypothetical protein